MVSASAFQVDDPSSILGTYTKNKQQKYLNQTSFSKEKMRRLAYNKTQVASLFLGTMNYKKHLIMVLNDCYLGI